MAGLMGGEPNNAHVRSDAGSASGRAARRDEQGTAVLVCDRHRAASFLPPATQWRRDRCWRVARAGGPLRAYGTRWDLVGTGNRHQAGSQPARQAKELPWPERREKRGARYKPFQDLTGRNTNHPDTTI